MGMRDRQEAPLLYAPSIGVESIQLQDWRLDRER